MSQWSKENEFSETYTCFVDSGQNIRLYMNRSNVWFFFYFLGKFYRSNTYVLPSQFDGVENVEKAQKEVILICKEEATKLSNQLKSVLKKENTSAKRPVLCTTRKLTEEELLT